MVRQAPLCFGKVVSGVEKDAVAGVGFVGDNLVAFPGMENHNTGFEQRTQFLVERVAVDIGGMFDHAEIREKRLNASNAIS